ASASGAIVTSDTATIDADGIGGAGGSSPFAAASGGGSGFGGGRADPTKGASIEVRDNGTVTLGDVRATAQGRSGLDGDGPTLVGPGDGDGGLVRVTAAGGDIQTDSFELAANGIRSPDDGGNGGRIVIAIGDAASGNAGTLATGATQLNASSRYAGATLQGTGTGTAGQISIRNASASPAGGIAFGAGGADFLASSAGTAAGGVPTIDVTAVDGPIAFLGNATFESAGAIAFFGNPAGIPAGIDALFQIGGALDIQTADALLLRDSADIRADNDAAIRAAQGIDGAGGTLRVGGDAGLFLGDGSLTLATLAIGGALNGIDGSGALITADRLDSNGPIAISDTLSVQGGGITLTAPTITIGSLATNGDSFLFAPGDVAVTTDIQVGGTLGASGANVSLHAQDALAVSFADASAGDVSISARQLTVDAASAPGTITLTTADPAAVGGASITTTTLSAGDSILIDAADNVTLADSATIDAINAITIVAGGVVRGEAGSRVGQGSSRGAPAQSVSIDAASIMLNGAVDGNVVSLQSAAIALGDDAAIGSDRTQVLSFASTAERTRIGGDDGNDGYVLSNAGLARARANTIEVVALAGGTDGATDIDTLDLRGSAASDMANLVGDDAAFRVISTADVRVIGAVTIVSAGTGDTFAVSADNRLDIVAPAGSIALFGTDDALAGRIQLEADTITAASEQTIADLAALSTLDSISARLGTPEGDAQPAGYLQANAIEFRVGNGLFIQNSGESAEPAARAGFTVGTGGVTIITAPVSGSSRIAINGRQVDADTYVTGGDLIPLLTIQGAEMPPPNFDPRSTANGCLIAAGSCQSGESGDAPPIFPVQDVLTSLFPPRDEDDSSGDAAGTIQRLNAPLIELAGFTGSGSAPILDDPVTGAGNDNFWGGPAAPGAGSDNGDDAPITGTRRDDDDDNDGGTQP
ncbi:MAG TPA: hypothetical protein VNQ31_01590, partial [Sphingomonadaceae bacterium]|nr:hypothetical protein [Sphingomonadaceae bacterium]